MKSNRMFLGLMGSALLMAGAMQSCVSEEPFGNGDGEGRLRMLVAVNTDITRADETAESLRENCTIYLSGADGQGLLYKYHGVSELPMDGVNLKSGNYVLEAWAGDSVPASFNKKFYRGVEKFLIESGSEKAVKLTCRVANVVVSVDTASVIKDLMAEWNVRVYNTTGALDFTPEVAADSTGYFMMSSKDIAYDAAGNMRRDSEGWNLYTNLYYTVSGRTTDGRSFEKTGLIGRELEGDTIVEHAHEYRLKFQYNPEYEAQGGGFITIKVDDTPLVEDHEVGLYSRPAIKGQNFEIDRQITGEAKGFGSYIVKVAGFNGIRTLRLSSVDYDKFGLPQQSFNLMDLADSDVEQQQKDCGIDWEYTPSDDPTKVSKCFIYLNSELLNRLEQRDHDYQIVIYAKDGNGREHEATVRIAVGDEAIVVEDPVILVAPDTEKAPMSILAKRAAITVSVDNEAQNPRVLYKKVSDADNAWISQPITLSRASRETVVTLANLEPGTEYICKAAAEGWTGTETFRFRTEDAYTIPFGDMETWASADSNTYKQYPGNDYTEANQFWDSGNHGSAGMSVSLTTGSNKMNHTPGGSKSAELKSQFVSVFGIGKFAAGNLFMGRFGATVGTSGARLTFGKPYNGSHPDKLSVWVSYTPGVVDKTANNCPYKFQSNEKDHGQIYVAFSTEPIPVNTGTSANGGVPANTFMQYDTDTRIIGFGEKTWKGETFGTSSSLDHLEIPIEWRKGAETQKPRYLIIVCSASKYGDYFTGSTGSIMYVDDFELVYE